LLVSKCPITHNTQQTQSICSSLLLERYFLYLKMIIIIYSSLVSYASPPIWKLHLPIIQACLLQWPPFSQHILQQCCNHPGIPSSTAKILLFNSVFYNGVTPVSISTLKPLLGVIGALPLKPQASPIISVCI